MSGTVAAEPQSEPTCAAEVVRASLTASAERLVRNCAALRDVLDADNVHAARVAVRRMRSDLRTFVPVLERAWACGLRERLRWLGDELAAARDADVMIGRMDERVSSLPAPDHGAGVMLVETFRAARAEAYEQLAVLVQGERYDALVSDVVAAAREPVFNPCGDDAPGHVVPALMADVWAQLTHAVNERGRPPSSRELHRIRIKTKRARYAAEAIAPVAGRGARRFAKRLARLQTILGDQHDAIVAAQRLRGVAAAPQTAFVAGELVALEERAAAEARGRWRDAWRKAAKKRLRFWRTT